MKISPSILSADFTRLASELKALEDGGADYIHVDVMDGRFVPNITIGPFVVEAIRRGTKLPLDVHLMIEEPERYIDDFARAGSSIITVHVEAATHLHRAVQAIKGHGLRAGVSINPGTPASSLEAIIGDVDLVLVMSVNPGFSGQDFIPATLGKISAVRRMIEATGTKIELEVDGGIKAGNIRTVAAAGADVFVSGSGVFSTRDYAKTISHMKKEIASA
ncbi:MAG: ribulose-phosphate 3-epimerase [Deltaproteobacteria bacterium]|nr:ribulose-phosphate 3-epimerase [Deltaproteobacteria bacterium]MBZ0220119.1 ribulose-phosphate 3-epimerase [Deltaproteobacteria bacterium]